METVDPPESEGISTFSAMLIRGIRRLDESGVGVALPDDPADEQVTFVQWVSTESADGTFEGLDRVEACFPRTRDGIAQSSTAVVRNVRLGKPWS